MKSRRGDPTSRGREAVTALQISVVLVRVVLAEAVLAGGGLGEVVDT